MHFTHPRAPRGEKAFRAEINKLSRRFEVVIQVSDPPPPQAVESRHALSGRRGLERRLADIHITPILALGCFGLRGSFDHGSGLTRRCTVQKQKFVPGSNHECKWGPKGVPQADPGRWASGTRCYGTLVSRYSEIELNRWPDSAAIHKPQDSWNENLKELRSYCRITEASCRS